jgi:outer membrane protein TolC
MSARARAVLLVGLGAALHGCGSTPSEEQAAWPPPVQREVLTRFQLEDPEGQIVPPGVPILGSPPDADAGSTDRSEATAGGLAVEEVLTSVEVHFPLILAALEEIEIARGQVLKARGNFDTSLKAKGKIEPEGFYETERLDVWIEQPTQLWGTTFMGGYRIGTGDFAVYDGEAKTNSGGEYRAGVSVPLLQGGRIDPSRVELWRSRIELEKAEPVILQKRLEATRKAANSYWKWVAAGQKRAITLRLLGLARDRQQQVELAVAEGELAEINLVENRRLIVERESNLVRAERALQQAAILLSLYLRDAEGRPLVPTDVMLPGEFPAPRSPDKTLVSGDVQVAMGRRPEVRAIELEIEALELELDLARNAMLPSLDLGLFASQDVGSAVNDPDDKEPFELEALVRFSLPLQRRKPRGTQQSLEGKINKLQREASFARDLVATDVQDAASALTQSWQRLAQARENVVLADRLEQAERLQLEAGQSDLFRVNLREQQTALAAASLVDVLAEHFMALTDYRAVLGIPYDEVRSGEGVGGASRP